MNVLHQRFGGNIIFTAATLDLEHILSINDTAIPDPQPFWGADFMFSVAHLFTASSVFHIHDCRGDYAYDASKGKGEVIKEEYFENCEWHIRALFEGERRVEESQLKCEGVGQTQVRVSYHAVSEDWGELADSEINVLDKFIEKEALNAMMAVLTKKQRNLIYQNFILDKTHQEIADGMGIARGSVTRSVNQALERIRRKFDFEAHYELAVGDFT